MALLFSLEGSTELTLKFSGSAAGLVRVRFLSLGKSTDIASDLLNQLLLRPSTKTFVFRLGGSVERSFRSRGITDYQVRVFLLLDPESRLKP